jgi:hypothetical protein
MDFDRSVGLCQLLAGPVFGRFWPSRGGALRNGRLSGNATLQRCPIDYRRRKVTIRLRMYVIAGFLALVIYLFLAAS